MPELQGLPTSQGLPFPGQTVGPCPQVPDQQQLQQQQINQYSGQQPLMKNPNQISPLLDQSNSPGYQQSQFPPSSLPGQLNSSGPPQNQYPPSSSIPGQVFGSQYPPNSLPGQKNSPPSMMGQSPFPSSTPRKQDPSVPLLPGQQNLPSTGPQSSLGSGQQISSGPPLSGQQNLLPVASIPGQQNFPNPMGGQQKNPLTTGENNHFGSMPGQNNAIRSPPSSGQESLQTPVRGPPMPGQQNFSSSLGGPQMPMPQSLQTAVGGPPMQQNSLGGGPMLGQQSLQPPVGGPPMPGQQNTIRSPQLSGQHSLQSSVGGPPMPGQQNFPNPMLGPQMPGQQSLQPPVGGPPMPGQQNFPNPMQGPQLTRQNPMAGPPMPGQPNFPNPMVGPQTPGQNLPGQGSMPYPGQLPSMQPHLTGNQAPGMNQYGQNSYMGPPLPGQPPMPGNPGYQQGYQNSYQAGYQQQQARRLDPDNMPNPIQVIQDDRNSRTGPFITNQKGLVPPLVTTKFTVQDQGNASPRLIRSTMYTVPTTTDIMKQTSVPFGLILSPMARVEDGEYEPPIVDMGEIGPVRCIRCKAYMSPFMQFIDSGRRFQCMFCKATTEVPAEYFQHLDHTGQRMDRYERPELMLGTYEFMATKDYCPENKFPNPPAMIFIIDVTYNTIKSGLVNLICAEMKNIIRNLPIDAGQTRTNMKVGFITYNNTVHFYNIKSCLAQPQMMVVGDVQDVFMPLLEGFLCDAEESLEVINNLMSQIPMMFADTRETETILAPAIQAGLEALKASECAGKLLVFHSSLPIAEAFGKLKNRDDRNLLGTEKEKTILTPQNNVYNTLGQDCVAAGCCVDLFIVNNSYIDIATIGQVCRLTGGEIYKYTYFQADIDGERLIADVVNNISRPIAFNSVMRVRTSTGVRPTDFYGHFYMSNTTDVELASIDCDKAIAIEVKHDDKLAEEEGVYVQAALLYTSCAGVRRLRIINLSLRTSSQIAELYRSCDLDAIISFFSKESVFKLLEHSPKAVKENLISRCANILAAYRKNCAAPSSAGQLILPECMKLLPLYVNCLMKSHAIFGGAEISIDDKSCEIQAVSKMPVHTSVNYFYPRMFALHNLNPQETDLPQTIRCSIDKITDDGCYLLENGIHMFLWLGLGLNAQWVQEVFQVPSVVQIDTERSKIPILDNPLNKRVNEIIARINDERHPRMRLTMVRQREKLEMVFRHFLVEDKGTDGSGSYVDFLCHMHKEIRAVLS
ncbi:protein transport protein Sec24C-like isoform X4 [Leptopilina boulardi]|uniref:protein transport protein Sec24C-like isoform X3 n=1 Tax=Leptopilina boulardi TaxID=63433 RepID=UPI0021F68FB1|nr:protein transport protein Sec24C-like isoform X3 [Leptopilina boulardi]XP_051160952.1 protein transport protein Sec24C-like isoform X4 [Leptopilina boulardi]